jgi:lysophospholipase L1-like esterase
LGLAAFDQRDICPAEGLAVSVFGVKFKPSDNSVADQRTYLALGDSMSIDLYTGKVGGGAVSQFFKSLGPDWRLLDHTVDGRTIPDVPTDICADLITLTIGGNDAIARYGEILSEGPSELVGDHLALLRKLRAANPDACFIVGNIYAPQTQLTHPLTLALDELNAGIAANVRTVGAQLADIRETFRGHEEVYLCCDIEPSLEGATHIARLFREEHEAWKSLSRS